MAVPLNGYFFIGDHFRPHEFMSPDNIITTMTALEEGTGKMLSMYFSEFSMNTLFYEMVQLGHAHVDTIVSSEDINILFPEFEDTFGTFDNVTVKF
jgi:hypothetical protein